MLQSSHEHSKKYIHNVFKSMKIQGLDDNLLHSSFSALTVLKNE